MNLLTFTFVAQLLREIGYTIRKTSAGDYVVRKMNAPKGEGYFTNDLSDALLTAVAMNNQ